MNKPSIISHSRHNTFEECPRKYQEEYLLGNRAERTQSDALIIGDFCHKSIEDYRTDDTVPSPLSRLTPRWDEWLNQFGLRGFEPKLSQVYQDQANLLWRASADCTDKSIWIRNKDGSVPKSLGMNKQYQGELEKLGIAERLTELDEAFHNHAGAGFLPVSVTNCYSETFEILKKFREHPEIASVDAIEFPISHRVFENGQYVKTIHEVWLPNGELFNGYIDEVATLIPALGGGRALGDHKSSAGDPPSVFEVQHHTQLNKYVVAYETLTKSLGVPEIVTHVYINHLRSGTLVLAEVDHDYAQFVWDRQHEVNAEIALAKKANLFRRRDPMGYNSPCLKVNKKTGEVSAMCGHLAACWPLLYAKATAAPELKDGFGSINV